MGYTNILMHQIQEQKEICVRIEQVALSSQWQTGSS